MNKTVKIIIFIIIIFIVGIAVALLKETETPAFVRVAIVVLLYPIYRGLFGKKENKKT